MRERSYRSLLIDNQPKWPKRIASSIESEEAAIRSMDWEEAQFWCNFVLMKPNALPDGLAIEKMEMRPEAPPGRYPAMDMRGRFQHNPSNRASHLSTLSGRGRSLHLKQFFYDLGPPAFDHPSFWLRRPRPFTVGNHIGWAGTEYRDLKGVSLNVDRTMIEISSAQGDFSDEELQTICCGLKPVAPEVRHQILATPIADLCYQSRYEDLIVTVPMGYWSHRRQPPTLQTTVVCAAHVPNQWLRMKISPPSAYGFDLDTAIAFGNTDQPQEIEWIYENVENLGQYLRILAWPIGAPNAPSFPLPIDKQPCSTQVLTVKGKEIHHAFLDKRYGQHEAVWQTNGLVVMVLVKPAPWVDEIWFRRLIGLMV